MVAIGVWWIQLDGFIVIRNGTIQVAFIPLGEAAIVVDVWRFRIQLNGSVVIGDCTVEVAFGLLGEPAFAGGTGAV